MALSWSLKCSDEPRADEEEETLEPASACLPCDTALEMPRDCSNASPDASLDARPLFWEKSDVLSWRSAAALPAVLPRPVVPAMSLCTSMSFEAALLLDAPSSSLRLEACSFC